MAVDVGTDLKNGGTTGTISEYLVEYLPSEYEEKLEFFDALYELHSRYRETGRLSAPMAPAEYAEEFILDAWAGLKLISIPNAATVADVGSGGGYPGLPWAILRPDLNVTLIEANSRKAEYLRYVTGELRLDKVVVKNTRAEDVEERYKIVTAKGLGFEALPLLEGLVKTDGRVVVFALSSVDSQRAGGALVLEDELRYVLPYRGTERAVAVYALGDVSRETPPANSDN
ncbi:MAG: class I SAM-dependent methyltransferase [Candidatus Coatesbacteria bacterium]|nr:MAG: class I SAM-dependent methyltransferase [Candidatus Coatesbacteria bacterium]